MTYTLHMAGVPGVVRDADGAGIPDDPGNRDWQAYQSWLKAGHQPHPAPVAAPMVVHSVTRRQFFQAAAQSGLVTQGEALGLLATGTMPEKLEKAVQLLPAADQYPARMMITGEPSFARNNALLVHLGTALGLTAQQFDALFQAAASA